MMVFPSRNNEDSESSSGLLFMRTFNRWHSAVKQQLRTLELTHPQFVVMASLGYLAQHKAVVTQTMVAHISGMDPMSVSQVLTLLEKHELVVRNPHPSDSRAKSVALTRRGEIQIQKALPLVEAVDQEFFGQLGEQESTFLTMLHLLNS